MPLEIPEPIQRYLTAQNTHDIGAMLAPFADDASVRDEGKEHRGRQAIREWMEETTRKYRVTVVVKDVALADGKTIVTGNVAGTFPGSPVDLRYFFELSGAKISRLEIIP